MVKYDKEGKIQMFSFESIGISSDCILLGAIAAILVLFIICISILVKQRKLKKTYAEFMKGSDGKTLEDSIKNRFSEIDSLKTDAETMKKKTKEMSEVLMTAYQKSSIVKYDAFKEMGGKLSFSLCLLDDNNDGMVITSMHSSREGCYTYVKEIIKGESFVLLSEEEKQALDEAKNKKNYMQ